MQAMVAYFDWMKNNTRPQDKVAGRGVGKVDPALKPDPENGRKVYARQCAVCHGENGEGLRNSAGEMLFPTAVGRRVVQYRRRHGAGPSTAAAFVSTTCRSASRNASPLGQGGLSDQDAVDVAEYFSHQPRPGLPGQDQGLAEGQASAGCPLLMPPKKPPVDASTGRFAPSWGRCASEDFQQFDVEHQHAVRGMLPTAWPP